MSTENRTKFEDQLPRPEKLSFDRIFGYTTGLTSLAGLVAAPFVVQNPDTLSYLFMGFLSILVLLLLTHAALVEKRKLHRYSQSVFYMHFAQHLVRDSLAEIQDTGKSDTKKTIEKILDAVANCFSIISGKKCRATLIELTHDFKLEVASRDSMSGIKATPRTKDHLLDENTDFKNLWYSINGCSRYYLNNNIPESWLSHKYESSSFNEVGDPESDKFLGINYIKKWPLSYRSALILPIRYISDHSPPTTVTCSPHWRYWGFLCIDSVSIKSFDVRYSPELGACFADMLYTYLNQSLLLTIPTNPA